MALNVPTFCQLLSMNLLECSSRNNTHICVVFFSHEILSHGVMDVLEKLINLEA